MVRLKGNLFAPGFPTSEEQMFRVSTLTFPFAYSFTLPVFLTLLNARLDRCHRQPCIYASVL